MSTKTLADQNIHSRVVLLISRSLSEQTDDILYALGATLGPKTPVTPPLLSKTPDLFPTISGNVSFATHLAVGVLDTSDWNDKNTTYLQKLQRTRYWEHLGSGVSSSLSKVAQGGIPGNCREWTADEIHTITAIEELGTIEKSDDVISCESKCSHFNLDLILG